MSVCRTCGGRGTISRVDSVGKRYTISCGKCGGGGFTSLQSASLLATPGYCPITGPPRMSREEQAAAAEKLRRECEEAEFARFAECLRQIELGRCPPRLEEFANDDAVFLGAWDLRGEDSTCSYCLEVHSRDYAQKLCDDFIRSRFPRAAKRSKTEEGQFQANLESLKIIGPFARRVIRKSKLRQWRDALSFRSRQLFVAAEAELECYLESLGRCCPDESASQWIRSYSQFLQIARKSTNADDVAARVICAALLGEYGPQNFTLALYKARDDDSSPLVRQEAEVALKRVHHQESFAKNECASLCNEGEVDPCSRAFEYDPGDWRFAAAGRIARTLNKRTISRVFRRVNREDGNSAALGLINRSDLKLRAVDALGSLGRYAGGSISLLKRLIKHSREDVRLAAQVAIERISIDASWPLSETIYWNWRSRMNRLCWSGTTSGSETLRLVSVSLLSKIGSLRAAKPEVIDMLLKDDSIRVRSEVTRSMS